MLVITGESDLNLICRREADGIAVLRCETEGGEVVLPGAIDGCPVVRLGDYAFSSTAPKKLPEDCFSVRISAGSTDSICHHADALEIVHLPNTVRHLGNYAFYNCTALQQLFVGECLLDVGTDAFMNCFSLKRVTLNGEPQNCRCLRSLLQQYSGELELRFVCANAPECRLFFPAYDEEYEEMAAPHIFHYNIAGKGYLCRQSFDGHLFNFAQYDAALDLLLRTHEFELAVRVALDRLEFPVQLSDSARTIYLDCLRQHSFEALRFLLGRKNMDHLAFFLRLDCLDQAGLSAGCDLARQLHHTEALSLLLEQQNRRFGAPKAKSFDL